MILAQNLSAPATPALRARRVAARIARAHRRCYNSRALSHRDSDRARQRETTLKQILEYIESFATVILVLAGIGGISWHLFRDDGWIEMAFGNIFKLHIQYPLIAIPVTFAAIIMLRMWRENRLAHGRLKELPNIFIYTLMALGVYFIGYFWIHGTL